MAFKTDYTREELIKICERAFVPQHQWRNRDSASSQISLGSCYALLKAGCEFDVLTTSDGNGCSTDDQTIWLQFYVHDFCWFEAGFEEGESRGSKSYDYQFYIPTPERLAANKRKDWY